MQYLLQIRDSRRKHATGRASLMNKPGRSSHEQSLYEKVTRSFRGEFNGRRICPTSRPESRNSGGTEKHHRRGRQDTDRAREKEEKNTAGYHSELELTETSALGRPRASVWTSEFRHSETSTTVFHQDQVSILQTMSDRGAYTSSGPGHESKSARGTSVLTEGQCTMATNSNANVIEEDGNQTNTSWVD